LGIDLIQLSYSHFSPYSVTHLIAYIESETITIGLIMVFIKL